MNIRSETEGLGTNPFVSDRLPVIWDTMRKIIRLATAKLGTQETAQLLTFFDPDGHLTVTQITLIR